MMIIKNTLLLTLLFLFGIELYAERPASDQADEDKFGNKHDWCAEVNYDHTLIIVDTTEKFNENQYELLQNQILNNSSIAKLPPYDRISILDLTGRNITATQTKPIFPNAGLEVERNLVNLNLINHLFGTLKKKCNKLTIFLIRI